MLKHKFNSSAVAVALVSAGIAIGAQAQGTRSADRQFAETAAIGGLSEVDAGNLAKRKAQDTEVNRLARRIVQDHMQANDRLKQIAAAKRIDLPTKLDKHAQQELDELRKLSGEAFDRAYVKAQVADHRKVIDQFDKEARSGGDRDIVEFARATLPTLREHLQLAESAERNVMAKFATMKKSNAQTLAAARAATGATRAETEKEDRMPVAQTGM